MQGPFGVGYRSSESAEEDPSVSIDSAEASDETPRGVKRGNRGLPRATGLRARHLRAVRGISGLSCFACRAQLREQVGTDY